MTEIRRQPAIGRLRDTFRGCLLGGAVADALGAPVEFITRSQIIDRFGEPGIRDFVEAYGKVGGFTDDTQMTLFTAEGMMRAWVRCKLRGLGPLFAPVTASAYMRWLLTQGFAGRIHAQRDGWLISHPELFSVRAPGLTCIHSLRMMEPSDDRARNGSKGCGGVMRVAPVGMFFSHWIEYGEQYVGEAFQTAADIAAITHGHPTGYLAAGAFAVIIALLLRGVGLPGSIVYAKRELLKHEGHSETLRAIESAEALAVAAPGSWEAMRTLGEGKIAEEALAIALYCALSVNYFEDAVVLAVNHDGDSDSTGSIAGNLLGAKLGAAHIPERWLSQVEMCSVIEEVADDLATVHEWNIGEGGDDAETEYYRNRYPGN